MSKAYHHVTRDIRSQIKVLIARGDSQRSIAKQLGYHPSTISREIIRNSGKRGYRLDQADRKAVERRSAASQEPKKMTAALKKKIIKGIKEKWAPVQLSGRLKDVGDFISAESIYKLIREDRQAGGKLYEHCRHRGKRYNRRLNGKKAGRGCIPNRVDISERPEIVEKKERIGDWEADTIIGAKNQGVILSVVDRHSKFVVLQLLNGKYMEGVVEAFKKRLLGLPAHTITFDNGKEFASHEKIAKVLNASCYFATPYHSWERGLNEHTNGLVRQYLPKSKNLKDVTEEELSAIEESLNHRPRKILDYKTPYEAFYKKPDPLAALICR